jgi:hypothetical protein
MAQRKLSRGKKDDQDEEIARILKKYEKEKNFRRLADQLGLSRHRTKKKKAKERKRSTHKSDGHVEEGEKEEEKEVQQHEEEEDDDDDDDEDDDDEEKSDEESDAFGVGEDFSPSEPSPTIPSGSESLSSELSLPQSFEDWRQKRKPFSSLSQFDDQLTTFSSTTTTTGMNTTRLTPTNEPTNDIMRKFYEMQVDKIRIQLKNISSKYQTTEKKLQEERQESQTKLQTLQVSTKVFISDRFFSVNGD